MVGWPALGFSASAVAAGLRVASEPKTPGLPLRLRVVAASDPCLPAPFWKAFAIEVFASAQIACTQQSSHFSVA